MTVKKPVLHFLFLFVCITSLTIKATANDFQVIDDEDNEIHVRVYPSESDRLLIWLVDHDEHRQMFEDMLLAVNKSGFEIWRVDLLEDYFLPRSSENQRTLPGNGVATLLAHAHKHTNKSIMLASYDRMPLTMLRGIHQWQKTAQPSRLSGAVLFYPILFGPAPIAGEDPVMDPIVSLTNVPVVIYQPDSGSQRWRLNEVMDALWKAGSPRCCRRRSVPRRRQPDGPTGRTR